LGVGRGADSSPLKKKKRCFEMLHRTLELERDVRNMVMNLWVP